MKQPDYDRILQTEMTSYEQKPKSEYSKQQSSIKVIVRQSSQISIDDEDYDLDQDQEQQKDQELKQLSQTCNQQENKIQELTQILTTQKKLEQYQTMDVSNQGDYYEQTPLQKQWQQKELNESQSSFKIPSVHKQPLGQQQFNQEKYELLFKAGQQIKQDLYINHQQLQKTQTIKEKNVLLCAKENLQKHLKMIEQQMAQCVTHNKMVSAINNQEQQENHNQSSDTLFQEINTHIISKLKNNNLKMYAKVNESIISSQSQGYYTIQKQIFQDKLSNELTNFKLNSLNKEGILYQNQEIQVDYKLNQIEDKLLSGQIIMFNNGQQLISHLQLDCFNQKEFGIKIIGAQINNRQIKPHDSIIQHFEIEFKQVDFQAFLGKISYVHINKEKKLQISLPILQNRFCIEQPLNENNDILLQNSVVFKNQSQILGTNKSFLQKSEDIKFFFNLGEFRMSKIQSTRKFYIKLKFLEFQYILYVKFMEDSQQFQVKGYSLIQNDKNLCNLISLTAFILSDYYR